MTDSPIFVGSRHRIRRWRNYGMSMGKGGISYIDKVLGIQSANMLAYWPLNELVGVNADNVEGTSARDGVYVGVTLGSILGPDGVNSAPLFDGINDFVNIYSNSLRDVFDGDEGTFAWWQRVFNLGVWSDATNRVSAILASNVGNQIFGLKTNAVNTFILGRDAGGGTKRATLPISSIAWQHFAITWSLSAGVNGEIKLYMDAIQQGLTLTALLAWVGNLDNTRCTLGANTSAPINLWHGYLAHANVWNIPLQQADITVLATV